MFFKLPVFCRFTILFWALPKKQYRYVFKTPGHAADLLSFGVMNQSRTANLAGLLAHAPYVLLRCKMLCIAL